VTRLSWTVGKTNQTTSCEGGTLQGEMQDALLLITKEINKRSRLSLWKKDPMSIKIIGFSKTIGPKITSP
jgi:hypothetical protein